MEAQPEAVLGALRRKVAAQLELHQYESAVFLADKLVSMSNGAEDVSVPRLSVFRCAPESHHAIAAHSQDVYTLAQAYFRAGMYQRAIYAIVEAGLLERPKFRCSAEPRTRIICSLAHAAHAHCLHLTHLCVRSFLAAKCHVAKDNWEEALQVLGESAVRP